VWQRNYYEHIIRDENSLNLIRRYIVGNPAQWAEDENNPDRLGAMNCAKSAWPTDRPFDDTTIITPLHPPEIRETPIAPYYKQGYNQSNVGALREMPLPKIPGRRALLWENQA